jgi:hypothetical protein
MNEENTTRREWRYVPLLTVILSLFLIVQVISGIRGYDRNEYPENVITVSGDGEVFAVPDIAEFSFGIVEEGVDVKSAQDKATTKINAALAALKGLGIEEKDIKTSGFNAYPKYEFNQIYCITTPCPQGKQEIVGYEVNVNITVKVRDIDDAGKAIDVVTTAGATNVSGISFTIDDEDSLLRDARKQAIDEAKEKAEVLADDLGVRLGKIVSFSENGGPYPIYYKTEAALMADGRGGAAPAPSLPTGENTISSSVTITYEIK